MLTTAIAFPQLKDATEQPIDVFANNNKVLFVQGPVLHGNITLAPLRGVLENLWAEVERDQATKTVKIV